MLVQLLSIARNTFIESVRQPIYFILIAIAGLMQLFTTWSAAFSMGLSDSGEVSGDNKLMLDISLATIFVCGMLLAAFLATAVLSREIENKTVLTVVSKPVGRPTVVFGKYVGVAAAIIIAVVTMLMFLQMGLRHEVMSTAADDLDGPVILFTLLAVGLAVGTAIWCNFFYGWVFTQTATMLLCPFMIVAVLLVMLISKKWAIQPISTNFKPQIAMASLCVLMAHLVITAIATAVSARLGQVMTLVICCGVFLGGLLSNQFLGRRAIDNQLVARVSAADPERPGQASFNQNGDTYKITLEIEPRVRFQANAPAFYGPNPSGADLCNLNAGPNAEQLANLTPEERLSSRAIPPGVIVQSAQGKDLVLRRIGADAPATSRPPQPGDYLFLRPTRYNAFAMAAWGVIPNVQFFWLVDAVTQNQHIPPSHIGLVALYGLMQIGAFLALGVILFQKREVG
jgi:hypothetical protein